jgi:glucoamylase
MDDKQHFAPGWPGLPARWTSSAKSGVGTALTRISRVWFTTSHGIIDEIYYPRIDQACTRDLGLVVTDGQGFFAEEKRDTRHEVRYPADGVPAYQLVNTDKSGRYRIEKTVLTDPWMDVLVQRVEFTPLQGDLDDYHLYVLLAPHITNQGMGNTAWLSEHKGMPMLFAERGIVTLALACSAPWRRRSVGFVGTSDGWQDLSAHKQMTWEYTRAENGNVALTAEVDLAAGNGAFVLAVGFGHNAAEAGHRARGSLLSSFEGIQEMYVGQWQGWQRTLLPLGEPEPGKRDLFALSAMVVRIHEAKEFPGGMIASLSIPWGFAKGDNDLGGYHLVWPRDMVQAAGGLLAAGGHEDANRILLYLTATQEQDGHWPQNMWIDSSPYWNGIQVDETALPILFVDLAHREGAISDHHLGNLWPMIRRAAGYLIRYGPVTQEDRWEEDPGYTPFTLASEIAALLVAADVADRCGEHALGTFMRETADAWNARIEVWIYAQGTDLARKVGVDGYYVRLAPPDDTPDSLAGDTVVIKNRPAGSTVAPATSIISADALALVRFGLRAPDDPRIVNTIKVIDALLKVDTPSGPAWHRYNDDGYGEHADGAPFDGTGIGRAWPLLTGERAHYELAAGHRDHAADLMDAMEEFAGVGGLIPEQIWDAPDIPARGLFCGHPSGSAMPLVWAHAEYLKLRRSLRDGQIFDMPPQTVGRYLRQHQDTPCVIWAFNNRVRHIPAGKTLRIHALSPARVRWSTDNWQTHQDMDTHDTGLSIHIADLPTGGLASGSRVEFTFYWPEVDHWEGTNYVVEVAS